MLSHRLRRWANIKPTLVKVTAYSFFGFYGAVVALSLGCVSCQNYCHPGNHTEISVVYLVYTAVCID